MPSSTSILIVEDNRSTAQHLQAVLERFGYQIAGVVGTGAEAIHFASVLKPDLILMDIALDGSMDGVTAAKHILAEAPIPVVFLTGKTDNHILDRAKQVQAYGFLIKPCDGLVLHSTVQMAIGKHRIECERDAQSERLRLVLATAEVGVFEWDVEQGEFTVNGLLEASTRSESHAKQDGLSEFLGRVHADDRSYVENTLASSIFSTRDFKLVFRYAMADRPYVYVEARGRCFPGRVTGAARVIGVLREVSEATAAAALAQRLESALSATCDNVALSYQPIIELVSGVPTIWELVVNWPGTHETMLPSGRVLRGPGARDLSDPVFGSLITTACRQLAETQRHCGRRLPLSLSFTAQQILDPRSLELLSTLLARTGYPPELIEIDISTHAKHSLEQLKAVVPRFKAFGVSLALDDFGSGYASMELLKALPIDRLKLEASFARDLPHTPESRAIIEAIARLAHRLNFRVTARGTDSHEQAELLRRLGCDEGQGKLYGSPVPSSDLEKLHMIFLV